MARTLEVIILGKDKLSSVLGGIQGSLNKMGIGVAAAGGAITAIGAGLSALAIQAAPVENIRAAFEGLAESSGQSADALLAALKEGSAGMVSQKDLMQTYNLAAQLVGDTFANQLPNAMEYLGKVSAATGEDMGYMLNSLVRGVGRLSPMILDNLGIQIDLEEAYAAWADTMGVATSEMTKADQQAAVMNAVMQQLAKNTAAMPDVTGTAAQGIAAMKASLEDTKNEIGLAFLPVLQELLPIFRDLADRFLPPLISLIEKFAGWFKELPAPIQLVVAAIGPLLTILGGLLIALAPLVPAISAVIGAIVGIGTPIGWVVGIIAGLVAIIGLLATAWANNWGGIRDIVQAVWENVLQPILRGIGEVLNWLASVILPPLQWAFATAWAFIQEVVAAAWAAIQPCLLELQDILREFWEEIQPRLQEAWAAIQIAMQLVQEWVTSTLIPALQSLWDRLEPVREAVIAVAASFASFMASGFISALKVWLQAIIGLWDGVAAAIDTVIGMIGSFMEAIGRAIEAWRGFSTVTGGGEVPTGGAPGFQSGMAYVPRRMVAVIDEGEAVLTKSQAQRWRQTPSYTIISNIDSVYGIDGIDEALDEAISRAARYVR